MGRSEVSCMKTYRVAAIGFAHSHINGVINSFVNCGKRIQIVAAADVKPRIPSVSEEHGTRVNGLREAIKRYSCPSYDDYTQLMDEHEFDIALVCCENAFHPIVAEKLLQSFDFS